MNAVLEVVKRSPPEIKAAVLNELVRELCDGPTLSVDQRRMLDVVLKILGSDPVGARVVLGDLLRAKAPRSQTPPTLTPEQERELEQRATNADSATPIEDIIQDYLRLAEIAA